MFSLSFSFFSAQFLCLAFSCEATPISKTTSSPLLTPLREENNIIGQFEVHGKAAPRNIKTTTELADERTQSSVEAETEQPSHTTEQQSINAADHKTDGDEEAQFNESSETTEKERTVFSIASIFRLLAKALKAAPHFIQ